MSSLEVVKLAAQAISDCVAWSKCRPLSFIRDVGVFGRMGIFRAAVFGGV
jgi:hypothetical protein